MAYQKSKDKETIIELSKTNAKLISENIKLSREKAEIEELFNELYQKVYGGK